jgi:hypothetical protein
MRPVWSATHDDAASTAKMVIASAYRLMEVRHFWRNR